MKLLLLIFSLLLFSCASKGYKEPEVKRARHFSGKGIAAIDRLIIDEKREYIVECYEVVARKEIPENSCQHRLFDALERRYGMGYVQANVDYTADDIFFRDLSSKIKKLIRSNRAVGRRVKRKFGSHEDLLAYYRKKYTFIHAN